ncbi:putative ABC transporter, ATP-binding/permease protein [Nocardia nova SH22a]|uniref:Putative ABC transporter, ATP-binding/permease protein n=1 Tax=Nocardia nova SH22a TaxID=1415166 RepID=W5TLL1_9NOCA|nr:ATP-binding cassette domain-containing protein [Nocardia nova]AHH19843.1 putative ABC transporter, ATP-binding/permease protein [Nocardia nova SH22a]
MSYLTFVVLGFGTGALFAALGVGLTTTYKGAGFINLAHAALAMWGAFTYDELRTSGQLVLPVAGIPDRIGLGGPCPAWAAVVIGIAVSALLGALAHLVIFKPLTNAPLVAKIVASLGLMLLLSTLIAVRFGNESRFPPAILPERTVHWGSVSFAESYLWLFGISVVLTAAVAIVYRTTLFGVATTARLQDESALELAGWSSTRIAVVNISAGVGLTTLVIILVSPTMSLDPQAVPTLIVPGLTAMLVGRLVGVVPAAAGGMALGVIQSGLTYMQTKPWFPTELATGGVTEAAPLIIILLVLIYNGRRLPGRGGIALEPLPRVPPTMRPRTITAILACVALVAPFLGSATRLGLIQSLIYSILALSLVLLVGMVGQISLGQLAVAGISALVLARWFANWPFPLGLLAAAAVGCLGALVVGAPALRVRGAQLAIVTLAAAGAVQDVVLDNLGSSVAGSSFGTIEFGPFDLSSQQGAAVGRLAFVYVVIVVLLCVAVAASMIMSGRTGKRFLSIRSNERAAASLGIDVARTKILALVISGFVAGIGGGLLAYSYGTVSADNFSVLGGISLLVFAYLGGITGIGGAMYAGIAAPGGVLVVIAGLSGVSTTYTMISSVLLIVIAIVYPNGTSDAVRVFLTRVTRKLVEREPAVPVVEIAAALDHSGQSVGSEIARLEMTTTGITVRYGSVVAVDDVSVTVRPGEIVGLIGPNGAGKTSFVDAVTGFAPSTGSVTVGGRDLSDAAAHRRFQAGVARTWQSGELFEDLTVLDNVRVGTNADEKWRLAKDLIGRKASDADARWALDLLELTPMASRLPGELSTGQRKLVGVARGLASRPGILVADEPAAGLDTFESRGLGDTLRTVADRGVGILLIEHDLALVMSICDRVYVLDRGRLIAQGPPAEVGADPEVLRAYIGGEVEAGDPVMAEQVRELR